MSSPMIWAIDACLVLLAISFFLTFIRLLKGPSIPDRVASLDLTSIIVLATVGLLCIRYQNAAFLDIAVVLAIVTFLSSVAFARYLERRAKP